MFFGLIMICNLQPEKVRQKGIQTSQLRLGNDLT